MKNNKRQIIAALIVLVIISAVYRVLPNRPLNFAPQWAMALFSGAMFVKNKKWAFALPLLSMFISDLLYHNLYVNGLSVIPGFYTGQMTNYILFGVLTAIGFLVNKKSVLSILAGAVAVPTVHFILSNFFIWFSGFGGLNRPHNFAGLIQTYNDAVPFYPNSIYATVLFSAVLFGSYFLISSTSRSAEKQIA
ncbi:MAG: hypothetical protein JWN76_3048 [Chitinophagaceae bacterium]|nr:hypothetical protein [Chitinophagaceae bacterium]